MLKATGHLYFFDGLREILRGPASLVGPLLASAALHAATFLMLDAAYGPQHASAPSKYSSARARRAPLQVVLADTAASLPGNPADRTQAEPLAKGLFTLPGAYYFPPQELSQKPQANAPVPLDYPADLPLVAKGHIVLRLLIGETGSVDQVIVEKTNLPKELEETARLAFAKARFNPGLRENRPVNSQLTVEVTFEADDAAAAPQPPGK
jgi:TonB family protein